MSERVSKLQTIAELVRQIPDGARIAIGGFAVYQKPMALVRELIRQKKRNLTLVGTVYSMDADLLIGAGCVSRIETSYVGLEKYGLAQNYRRAVQQGTISVVHYPEMLAWDRFRADREGWPFWPCYSLAGSENLLSNPDIQEYTCPVTGRTAWALPAAKPDYVLLHVYRGDCYGNLQVQGRSMFPQALDVEMARSCGKVLATVEELVPNEELRKNPHLNLIPAFRTTGLCYVKYGSHPLSTLLSVKEDETALLDYAQISKTPEGFAEYLNTYIYGTADEAAYQALWGQQHLEHLKEETEWTLP